MKRLSLLILPVLLALSGCASIFTNPAPGSTVAEVIALKGQPDAQYQDGNTTLLEWSVPAYGDHAWMARIGPDGKLISYKQVLTRENFGTIKINEFTKNDVLKTVGHPTETEMSPLSGYEIWSYRYLEEGYGSNDAWFFSIATESSGKWKTGRIRCTCSTDKE